MSICSSNSRIGLVDQKFCYFKSKTKNIVNLSPFSKRQILISSELKECADDNFEFNKNDRKVYKNNVEKGEITRYEQFSLSVIVFSKDLYYSNVKTRSCLGKN